MLFAISHTLKMRWALLVIPFLLLSCKATTSKQDNKSVPSSQMQNFVSQSWRWQKMQFEKMPQARWGHASCYIPEKNAMLVTGGTDTIDTFADAWILELSRDKERWIQLPIKMPQLWGHSLVYDAVNRKAVIFGGVDDAGDAKNDTYVLDLTDLKIPKLQMLKLFNQPPTSRSQCSAFYESLYKCLLVFGGEDANGKSLSDTWVLDLIPAYHRQEARWLQLQSLGSSAPGKRANFGGAYDSIGSRILLFGGSTSHTENGDVMTFGDLWEGRIGSKHIIWNEIMPILADENIKFKRHSIGATLYEYDGVRALAILFGDGAGGKSSEAIMIAGLENDKPILAKVPIDTAFDIPSPRSMVSAIYDEKNHRFVVFGGISQLATNEVWALEHTNY